MVNLWLHLGQAECESELRSGDVSGLTVDQRYRRHDLARTLMHKLEDMCIDNLSFRFAF